MENTLAGENCVLCKDALLGVGKKSNYGASIIFKIGNSEENSLFATLSPKTGGNAETDFSIQLSPAMHLKYFSDINQYPELAKNYGLAFAKICAAAGQIISEESDDKERIPIGTYGKSKHPDEHLHIKIFPWKNDIGQPYTVDSTYERKEVFEDENGEFVKMRPVKKKLLSAKRFEYLTKRFIDLLR